MLARPEWTLLIALAIGLLIGLERERHKGDGPTRAPAGLRTFAIVGLLGGLTATFGDSGLVLVVGALVGVGILIAYALGDRSDPGLTGEVALIATYVLGVLAPTKPILALEVGIVVAALLAFRVQLHHVVRERITDQDLRDGLTFAIAAVVILPLLPNRAIDPYGLLNPFALGRLAVVAMGLSAVGYIAQRLVGARYGLLVAGLASGLVSSTAAVVAMGGRSRASPTAGSASAAGAVASLVGSLGYLTALIGAVSPNLLAVLALPLGLAAGLILLYAAWLVRGTPRDTEDVTPTGRAFNGLVVAWFVVLVGGFSLLSEQLVIWLGTPGALVGAGVLGLADAHAAAISMATLNANGSLASGPAAIAVLLTFTTNMAIKVPAAFMSGSRPYGIKVVWGVLLLLVGLWAGEAIMLLSGPSL
ncbi:DUF4010 domain-containing protein [Phenylobacterium sp.]|uniref:MgtC/SapB family protein n=1 Tax=Phenylobacterium sp. TaxID=1871053 RepID=UPI0030F40BED